MNNTVNFEQINIDKHGMIEIKFNQELLVPDFAKEFLLLEQKINNLKNQTLYNQSVE